jgi:hypothetical protein
MMEVPGEDLEMCLATCLLNGPGSVCLITCGHVGLGIYAAMVVLLLWPNLAVLELAPTTAKVLDEKKVLRDASVLIAAVVR